MIPYKKLSFPNLLCLIFLSWSCTSQTGEPERKMTTAGKPAIQAVNHNAISPGTDTLAIIHARIITGDGTTVIEDGCVLVVGERIATVSRFADTTIPESSVVLDATGSTLLPGLIDAHFHLDQMDSLPSLVLSRGITSLRDPGAWIEAYEGERASGRPLPRLYLTGPHIDMFPPAYPKDAVIVRDPAEALTAVDRAAGQGASAIKIYFRSSPEIIQAVTTAAHARGLPVTAHLEISDIYDAVAKGINGIEHITSLGSNLVPNRQAEVYKQAILRDNNARKSGRYTMWQNIDAQGAPAEQLGRFLAERKIFLCPTLGAFEYQSTPDNPDSIRLQAFQNMLLYTKKLHDLGVPIVVGSHSWVPYADYGWAYQHELELLEKLGMTPLEIIHAATLQNARFFRIADQLGSIEAGKLADLVLIDGDPLAGVAAVRKTKKVMMAGKWIK